MEHLMSKEVNILIVAEGPKAERNFIEQLNKTFNINFNVFCYGTNIYNLYKRMKELDFNADLTQVLLELPEDPCIPDRKKLLNKKFAYTYLIFDFDAHHTEEYEKNAPIDKIVSENIQRLKEMTEHFTNETDPTIGKLYVNYPMMESYRDADSLFDENFMSNYISISNIKNYKRIVGQKNLANKRIDSYTDENFISLASMNVHKLSKLMFDEWAPIDYSVYIEKSDSRCIIDAQEKSVIENRSVCVLNTTLFLLIDYFGNQKGFYDRLFE